MLVLATIRYTFDTCVYVCDFTLYNFFFQSMTKAWIFHKFFTSKKICMYSVLKIYNVCGGRIVLEGFKSCGGCRRRSTLRLIEVKVLHKMFALYWRCLKISSFSKPGLLLLELWRHSKQWVCAKYTLILLHIL